MSEILVTFADTRNSEVGVSPCYLLLNISALFCEERRTKGLRGEDRVEEI